jgi:hypothetical protein
MTQRLEQTFTITVDLKKNIAIASQTPQFIANDTNVLFIRVLENGKPYDYQSADRVVVNLKRKDGIVVNALASYDEETEMIKYVVGATETELEGNLEANISLFLSGTRVTSKNFMIKVSSDFEQGIPSEEGYSVLQSLFIETETVKQTAQEKALYAQESGDYARAIRDNFGHKGDYSPSTAYKNGNVVSYGGTNYICVQDTTAGINPLNGAYWTVVAPSATFNEQTWTATSGQKTFTISNGKYVVGKGNIQVFVGGVPQASGINFTESSETTISFSEAVPTGVTVYAKWMEGALSITKGHKTGHEKGGQDELDVTQLKNFKENVTDQFTSVNASLAEKATKVELIPLANKDYVDSQILTVNTGGTIDLSRKADKSYVDETANGLNEKKYTYAYLSDGSVQTITEKDKTNAVISITTFTYKANGDVDTSAKVMGGQTVTTQYVYDTNGNLTDTINTKS